MGRFINADSFLATSKGLVGHNMFAYCNNNPIIFSDYNGNEPTYALDTDDDGVDDCFVYEYSYTEVIEKNLITISWDVQGKVYFYTGKNRDDMESLDYPEGFNPHTDVLVADLSDTEETLYVYQAQHVSSKNQRAVIKCMQTYDSDFNTKWNRSDKSLLVEWRAHNLFAPFHVSAQNVDFDNKEEGKDYGYFIRKAISRAFGVSLY